MILHEDSTTPSIYVVGTRVFEDRLQEYVRELTAAVADQATVTYVDIESNDGAELSELLDIETERLPATLILEDDESVYKDWYGENLPDAQDVAFELGQLTGTSEA